MQNFKTYFEEQRGRDDPIGDLATDMWIFCEGNIPKTIGEMRRHLILRGVDKEIKDLLEEAWMEYKTIKNWQKMQLI